MAFFIVLIAVILNISSALLLKTLADIDNITLIVLVMGIGGAIALNALRFAVWGYAHNKFPLSTTYPISSMFFPLMLLVAYIYGDPISLHKIIGTCLITTGVMWLMLRTKS